MSEPNGACQTVGTKSFPNTCWTQIRDSRDRSNPVEARQAFERLCKGYWAPLYAYARAIGLSPDDARRLVNELFYRMTYELFPCHYPDLEIPEIPHNERPIGKKRDAVTGGEVPLLERAEHFRDRNREKHGESAGRLRDFLMLQIKTIARSDWRSSKRQSQDGDVFSVPDAAMVEHELADDLKLAQKMASPDEIFLLRWRSTLLKHARQALRREMEEKGELERLDAVWPLVDRETNHTITSQQVAAVLGMTDGGVRALVSRLKNRLRDHIIHQIADTLDSTDPEVLADEIRMLFSPGSFVR
jgi:RNA polymerase sigma-70 factor (ECF subfamily)